MIHRRSPAQASIAAALAVVVLGLGLGVPLLDLGLDPSRLAIADGDAPAGLLDHDHGLCVLYNAAAWSPAASIEAPTHAVVRVVERPAAPVTRLATAGHSLPRSRAPPSSDL